MVIFLCDQDSIKNASSSLVPQPVVPSGLLVYLKRNVSSEAGPRAAPRGSIASWPVLGT